MDDEYDGYDSWPWSDNEDEQYDGRFSVDPYQEKEDQKNEHEQDGDHEKKDCDEKNNELLQPKRLKLKLKGKSNRKTAPRTATKEGQSEILTPSTSSMLRTHKDVARGLSKTTAEAIAVAKEDESETVTPSGINMLQSPKDTVKKFICSSSESSESDEANEGESEIGTLSTSTMSISHKDPVKEFIVSSSESDCPEEIKSVAKSPAASTSNIQMFEDSSSEELMLGQGEGITFRKKQKKTNQLEVDSSSDEFVSGQRGRLTQKPNESKELQEDSSSDEFVPGQPGSSAFKQKQKKLAKSKSYFSSILDEEIPDL